MSIKIHNLTKMLKAEVAAIEGFRNLSKIEQTIYLKANPETALFKGLIKGAKGIVNAIHNRYTPKINNRIEPTFDPISKLKEVHEPESNNDDNLSATTHAAMHDSGFIPSTKFAKANHKKFRPTTEANRKGLKQRLRNAGYKSVRNDDNKIYMRHPIGHEVHFHNDGSAAHISKKAELEHAAYFKANTGNFMVTAAKGGFKTAFHNHLIGQGFKKTGYDQKNSKGRYVKSGFYDGDYPNAHETFVREENHSFSAPDNDKKYFHDLHKHLINAGFKGKISPSGDKNRMYGNYTKGVHYISTLHRGGKITLTHNIRTTKPDKEYDRSGRGRGQII